MDEITSTQEKEIDKFTRACTLYLGGLCIGDLRSYGRDLGVARPTVMKKEELTAAIIGILTGRLMPIEISNQGAPVKNDYVDTRIPEKIETLKRTFMPTVCEQMEIRYRMERAQENKPVFFLRDVNGEEIIEEVLQKPSTDCLVNPFEIYRGQVEIVNGEYYIYPLNCDMERGVVSVTAELALSKRLRAGDVVSYRAYMNRVLGGTATEILTVNSSLSALPPQLARFEDCVSFCSSERISVYKANKYDAASVKFIDWLLPVCMGQRACVVAPPKSGKSLLLQEVARAVKGLNEEIKTYALLINQSMDVIYTYSRFISKENLVYTTCEEGSDRHVFVAEFLLRRLKRMAENGENVFLVVDSLSELARAFNETEASLGGTRFSCGLEEGTIAYIKRYFNSAKYLVRGGSITMLAAINAQTGDPVDELLSKELCAISNYQITLTDRLVKKRIFPALEYVGCNAEKIEKVRSKAEQAFDELLRKEICDKIGDEGIVAALEIATSRRHFLKIMQEIYYDKV